jgi:hypothetical protein
MKLEEWVELSNDKIQEILDYKDGKIAKSSLIKDSFLIIDKNGNLEDDCLKTENNNFEVEEGKFLRHINYVMNEEI